MEHTTRFKVIRIVVFVALIAIGFYMFRPKAPAGKQEALTVPQDVSVTGGAVTSGDGSLVSYDGGDYTLSYPADFSVDANYAYQAFGPDKDIAGVSFTIPSSLADGTNLSDDTKISIEPMPIGKACDASQYLPAPSGRKTVTEHGVTYSYAESHDAGAGNRYDEYVYALPASNLCIGIRYFIHYGVIDNYPIGEIKKFDEVQLTKIFDSIRNTIVIK